jgi:2-methylcitrate dehydratase
LWNTALVRAIDFNDHLALDPNSGAKRGGHPSDNFSAILATGECMDASGAEVIEALLAGYELYGRIYGFLPPELPWDHTTAFSLTIPAVAGRMLKLAPEQTAHAIALSAAQSATLSVVRRGQLSHSKFMASAFVAQRGVECALLAKAGMTGPMTLFEDRSGYAAGIFRTTAEAAASLVAPFNGLHMVEGVTIKAFPGMDTSQAAAEAAVFVSRGDKLRAGDIESLEIICSDRPQSVEQGNDPERRTPQSRETADHSIFYMVAVGLLDGEITPRQFETGRWFDPEVCSLMQRANIRYEPALTEKAPGGFPCIVKLRMRGGEEREHEVLYASGHARNKMNRQTLAGKFLGCVEGRIAADRAQQIMDIVGSLDRLDSIRQLTRLLG